MSPNGSFLLTLYIRCLGIPIRDVARDLNMGTSTVGNWMTDTYKPSLTAAKRIAVYTCDEVPVKSWGYPDTPISKLQETYHHDYTLSN